LEALKECQSVSELAQKHELSPAQISSWQKEFLSNSELVFERKSLNSNHASFFTKPYPYGGLVINDA